MSFLSLPHDFDSNTGECTGYEIARQDNGERSLVGFLRGYKGLPCDLRKLAENFVSVLNGRPPLYREANGQDMYFTRLAEGLAFNFKDPGKGGVSEMRAMFTAVPGVPFELDEARLSGVQELCASHSVTVRGAAAQPVKQDRKRQPRPTV